MSIHYSHSLFPFTISIRNCFNSLFPFTISFANIHSLFFDVSNLYLPAAILIVGKVPARIAFLILYMVLGRPLPAFDYDSRNPLVGGPYNPKMGAKTFVWGEHMFCNPPKWAEHVFLFGVNACFGFMCWRLGLRFEALVLGRPIPKHRQTIQASIRGKLVIVKYVSVPHKGDVVFSNLFRHCREPVYIYGHILG